MIIVGDALEVLRSRPEGEARCCVTSPPYYGLRDYGVAGQIGMESAPEDYVTRLVHVFREVRRVLADDGTLWLNLGDSYAHSGQGGATGAATALNGGVASQNASKHVRVNRLVPGLKPKDLVGIPWMVAFALRADGWYLRQDIVWAKPNPMPESVRDRCTRGHEYLFLLSKSPRYYWDAEAAKEPASGRCSGRVAEDKSRAKPGFRLRAGFVKSGAKRWERRNRRSVWTIGSQPFKGAHFATFPPRLIEPCIAIGSAPDDIVLDPFAGAGTTSLVARRLGRKFLGIELNPEYAAMATRRIEEAP